MLNPPSNDALEPLRLLDVSAGYGPVEVLSGIDIRVRPAEVVALIGPNGAGKTTLLRVAAGILSPSAGHVEFFGRAVGGASVDRLSRTGLCYVPEGRGIFRSLTVRDNIELFAGRRRARDGLRLALEAFPELEPLLGRKAGTLSGGEQQMVSLSRIKIAEPAIALLDEVSVGLAPKVVRRIYDFVGSLRETGTSLLLVEQFVTEALNIADYVHIMNRGRIVKSEIPSAIGDVDAVFGEYFATDSSEKRRTNEN